MRTSQPTGSKGLNDAEVIELWLRRQRSSATQSVYRRDVRRLTTWSDKTLAEIDLNEIESDKDGNYKGTHAPAEDCLLKPEDVQRWRLGDAVTRADKWTRGREALPMPAAQRPRTGVRFRATRKEREKAGGDPHGK